MCHHQYHGEENSEAIKKEKFYRHLRVYLTVVGFVFFARFFSQGHFGGMPSFAFWWGVGVVAHYLSVFGWRSLTENDAWTQCDRSYENEETIVPEPPIDLREKRKSWRERDLV